MPKNREDWGKLIVAKGLKKLPKVKNIAQSGHTEDDLHAVGCGEGPLVLVTPLRLGDKHLLYFMDAGFYVVSIALFHM